MRLSARAPDHPDRRDDHAAEAALFRRADDDHRSAGTEAHTIFTGMMLWMVETYANKDILNGLAAIKANVDAGKPFEASRSCARCCRSRTRSSASRARTTLFFSRLCNDDGFVDHEHDDHERDDVDLDEQFEFLRLDIFDCRLQLVLEAPDRSASIPGSDQSQDATAFVSQLASFSQVEQGIKTNSKLDSLMTSMALTQASNMIGRTVTSSDGSVSGTVKSVNIVTGGA